MKRLIGKIERREISIEEALQDLMKRGYCPNLINYDQGRWALTFDGMQNIGEEEDMIITHFVENRFWKRRIRDAVLYSLSDDLIKNKEIT